MHLFEPELISIHLKIDKLNIRWQNKTNLTVFDIIYTRKESAIYKNKHTFNSWITFNEKGGFGGYWEYHKY